MRRKAGGDTLRTTTGNQRGSTDGRYAQSAVGAGNTRITPKARENRAPLDLTRDQLTNLRDMPRFVVAPDGTAHDRTVHVHVNKRGGSKVAVYVDPLRVKQH